MAITWREHFHDDANLIANIGTGEDVCPATALITLNSGERCVIRWKFDWNAGTTDDITVKVFARRIAGTNVSPTEGDNEWSKIDEFTVTSAKDLEFVQREYEGNGGAIQSTVVASGVTDTIDLEEMEVGRDNVSL